MYLVVEFVLLFVVSSSEPHHSSRSQLLCGWGYYLDLFSLSCLKCNSACADCIGPEAFECIICSNGYLSFFGICINQCPLGYVKGTSSCTDNSKSGVIYNLNLTLIQDNVFEESKCGSSAIKLQCGQKSSFYPSYDNSDPFVIKSRGFYFNGSGYIKSTDTSLVYPSVFTIGT